MADALDLTDESLAAALVEAAPDAILVVEASGRIAFANRMASTLFGYSHEELVGTMIEALVPPEIRERHHAVREAYQAEPRARPMGTGLALSAAKKNGQIVPVEISLSPVHTPKGVYSIAIVRDVSRRRAYEEELFRLGTQDALTGLHNRAFFDAERARLESSRTAIGVISIDVDGLKAANDERGHEAGDDLLRRTARVFRASFRAHDILARTGGDEFIALLDDVDPARLDHAVARLREELLRDNAKPQEFPATLCFSIGTALADSGAALVEALRLADARMYADKRARRAGRDCDVPPSA